MEKSTTSLWIIAWKHYLLAGLVMPFVVGLLLLSIGLGVIGTEELVKLFLLGSISGIQNTLLSYLPGIVLWMIAYFVGTCWSTKVIGKRHEVSDREKIILYATILLLLEVVLLVGWSISKRFSLFAALDSLVRITLSVGLFYVISRQFLLKKIVWSKFSIALLVLVLGAAGGTAYLVDRTKSNSTITGVIIYRAD